jgi:hypothetical protein
LDRLVPARDGLRAVRDLLDAVRDDSALGRLSDAETVESDLQELVRCLKVAVGREADFRLAII